ncbi:DUF2339 domain-containing protein [Dyella koreensis]|uniref:DUF2339 domain-containing protein n=1 Tax=Dyella koreensis TaxID=311235 RepID=A0ABW8KBY5_9GAMM
MYFLWMVVGAVLGAIAGQSVFAALSGTVLGLLWARQSTLSRELRDTRATLDALAAGSKSAPTPAESRPFPLVAPPAATVVAAPMPVRDTQPSLVIDNPPSSLPKPVPEPVRASPPASPPPPPSGPTLLERVWGWFTEGNVPVKIGMLVLFAGVAALLKYASDSGLLHVPIGLRISLVAVAAIAALGFGWRQRTERRVFALSLQGGAIGVLLITIFAAFRLYDLLPPAAAFALLVLLVAGIGVLAVLQDALALAVLGLLAGFAAPILVSTGSGSHVALFSYYAVLNIAVLAIAWVRSWRVLNLLGFIATFGVGTAWGVLRYQHELFASTEPFLILNFLFYLVIPWLHVLRAPADRRLVIDGSLLFGNPIVSLLLQGALLRWQGQSLAFSALIAAAIYVFVAFSVRHRSGLRLLRDAWAVLAVSLATLAVPLALSAGVTGSIFALEGAGLIWLGLKQQRALSRWSGLALQVFAASALLIARTGHAYDTMLPLLNGDFVGALLLVAAAFAGSTFYARWGGDTSTQRLISVALYGWGLGWWLLACHAEIVHFAGPSMRLAWGIALLALTAWGVAEVAQRRPPHELGKVIAFTVPALFAAVLLLLIQCGVEEQQLLVGWRLLSVAFAAVLGWRALACLRAYPLAATLAQLAWLWRWGVIFTVAIGVAFIGSRWLSTNWYVVLASIPLLLLLALALWQPRWIASPLSELLPQWRPPLLHSLLMVLGALGLWALLQDGDAAPLHYLPLLNPVDVLLLLIALCVARWLIDPATSPALRQARPIMLGVFVLLFTTSATLRGVHHLAGVPWNSALSDSSLAQMSLTVVWSALGLLAWVWGSRRGQRLVWLAGAVMMGVVLAKLLLIDRGHLGNLFGIGSFIAYGLLCTVIGYLAPAPPKRPLSSEEEAAHAP